MSGVSDRAARAFGTVVQALSLLRPGGRSNNDKKKKTGEPSLRVVIHAARGVCSRRKVFVTARFGKQKRQTSKKKISSLDWEYSTEFTPYTPTERKKLILTVRKAKRCKTSIISQVAIDVAALVEAEDLPVGWWYMLETDKMETYRNKKEVMFLKVTVTVDGPKMESESTHDQAKTTSEIPSEPKDSECDVVSQENEIHSSESVHDADRSPSSAVSDIADPEAKSSSTKSGTDASTCISLPSAINDIANVKPESSSTKSGTDNSLPSTTGDIAEDKSGSSSTKSGEDISLPSTVNDIANIKLGSSSTKSGTDNPLPSIAGEIAVIKPESSSTASSTSKEEASTKTSSSTTDKAPTNGEGDHDVKTSHELRPSRIRQLVQFIRKKTEKPTTTQGEETAIPTASLPPPHRDSEDPRYQEVMASIDRQWEELMPKRAHSDELLAYANSLRAKLTVAAPHVLEYAMIKNLTATVPDYTHYELPERQGMSLEELTKIEKTVAMLVEDQEKRATYIKRWYLDDLCRVAMEEAPHVLAKD
ncbi:Hypp8608 [Branchiostoma lanceolatum]|uniref:Hypp8608 protein n=1 Tax=Branchiostoma lanceolatum TaxID=7740 RepID=A0A8K0EHV4_BRALA|nr:Hypp8608 [Branchiostoma lanceolatum]